MQHVMKKLLGVGICLAGAAVSHTINHQVGHAITHIGIHMAKH